MLGKAVHGKVSRQGSAWGSGCPLGAADCYALQGLSAGEAMGVVEPCTEAAAHIAGKRFLGAGGTVPTCRGLRGGPQSWEEKLPLPLAVPLLRPLLTELNIVLGGKRK